MLGESDGKVEIVREEQSLKKSLFATREDQDSEVPHQGGEILFGLLHKVAGFPLHLGEQR